MIYNYYLRRVVDLKPNSMEHLILRLNSLTYRNSEQRNVFYHSSNLLSYSKCFRKLYADSLYNNPQCHIRSKTFAMSQKTIHEYYLLSIDFQTQSNFNTGNWFTVVTWSKSWLVFINEFHIENKIIPMFKN